MTLRLAKTCQVLLMGDVQNDLVTISSKTLFKKSDECKDTQFITQLPIQQEDEKKLAADTIVGSDGKESVLKKGTKIRIVKGTLVIIAEKSIRGLVNTVLDVEIA